VAVAVACSVSGVTPPVKGRVARVVVTVARSDCATSAPAAGSVEWLEDSTAEV